jgi:two-component system cell cycle sensor histidine kinase/response regulator CckA
MLAENVHDAVWTADLDLKFTSVSPSIIRLCGFTSEEMMGKSMKHYFSQASLVMAETVLAEELENEKDDRPIDPNRSRTIELEMLHKDGRTIWIETMAIFRRDDENRPIEILGVARDITERKNAAEALKQSEERFRDLAELLPETVFETDLAGNFTFVNQSVHEQFGYEAEDLTGRLSIMDMIVPEDRDFGRRNMQRVLSGEKVGLKEYTARKKNDSTFPVMVHSTPIIKDGRPTGLRGFLIDISEKKNLEEQLMRAQKMEAIGTLAGGIAHDFNNLLMGILGNVSLMMMKVDETHQFHDRLKSVEEYVQRGSDLTKQLLGFARGGKYEVKPTNLGEFIQRSSEMFGRTKKEIRIHRKAQEDLWTVEVDHGQMEQVLLNLYVNAWQAMPGGGELYISAENVELDMKEVSLYELKPGRYVKISVTDTGTGMDEATMARIFEPFFTTKERGRGTGLGLASVYGIIKNHGGFIKVESEKGVGSTFTINLPASGKAAEGEKKTGEQVSRGRETILLIDDEDMILDVGAQMLSSLGYSVLAAQGGSAGVDVYRENREDIDLVILDVIMPDLGGDVTFERLRNIDQTVNVLLSSGYSLDGQAKEIMEKGCKGFIQKPFSMEDLSKKIRGILDQQ